MARFRVLEPLRCDGKRYAPGDVAELHPKVGATMARLGVVEAVGDDLPFTEPAPVGAPAETAKKKRTK